MLLFWLTACDPTGAAVTVPWVSADPIDTEISFEQTWLLVTVRNTGTDVASVSLAVDPPFVLLPNHLRIEAGDHETTLLTVTPDDYRPLHATITMRTGLQVATSDIDVSVDADGDGDGFTALAAGGDDCDDSRADVHPAAFEVCNGNDDDCDGTIDDDALGTQNWYSDDDGDSWGGTLLVNDCVGPAGSVSRGGDCDDDDDAIHPGASEIFYDGIDENCSGGSDYDADGDGFDSAAHGGDDCNDGNPNAHPGADDPPGGSDLDCNGTP
jgi:hypothetical protein